MMYCFHSVDGYSKVGSFIGNGNADGPFVHCGFRPAYVMVKRTDAAGAWAIIDTSRSEYNLSVGYLIPNTTATENTATSNSIDVLSNGFKLRGTGATFNASGVTLIFIAFAEMPFKHSNAR